VNLNFFNKRFKKLNKIQIDKLNTSQKEAEFLRSELNSMHSIIKADEMKSRDLEKYNF
jgi:hypothetical protein